MLKSESSPSTLRFRPTRAVLLAVCLLAVCLTLLSSASAQNFTLQIGGFNPFAVAPGQTSSASITVGTTNSFSGTVDLTCTVTTNSQQTGIVLPDCALSPPSVSPPGGSTLTVNTTTANGVASAGAYIITVTGSANGLPSQSLTQSLTVLAVAPAFTITVSTPVAPNSVHAGSGGQATIAVTPIGSYSGNVTLSCTSISPLVLVPPVCSFTYPGPAGQSYVAIAGAPQDVTLTINTTGPVTRNANARARNFYALWLPVPMLALLGLGAAGGRRSRKIYGVLALLVLCGALLLMPACGNTNLTTTGQVANPNGQTPKNTYTFTVVGVDATGNTSSNTGTTGSPSVTLTVN